MQLKKEKIMTILAQKEETQTDISKRLGVSRQLIGAWIHGDRSPKFDTVQKLADALGCSMADIADFDDSTEESAACGNKFAQAMIRQEEQENDYIKSRIDEIYSGLDRAGRAEMLAYAEQIAKRSTPIMPVVGSERVEIPTIKEKAHRAIPTEVVARMVNELDNPTATPRGTLEGRPLLDVEVECPMCHKHFFIPRTSRGAKMACPLCGQHVMIP